jgi:phosphoribosylformylglycinamidine cyclo-ligase
LLTPTRIYVRQLLETIRANPTAVKALAHITGGGLIDNLPRVLPDTLTAILDQSAFHLPPVFEWLQVEARLDDREMLRTFNCGVGMVVVVAASDAGAVIKGLGALGQEAIDIGTLAARDDGEPVRLEGGPWSAS